METRFLSVGILSCLLMVSSGCINQPPVNVWSECRNDSAYVYIGADEDVKKVKCVALDKEFFNNTEVFVGDLSKNDEDVCRFSLIRTTTQPLRFEVWYNDRVQKEVCDWQHYQTYSD